MFQVGWAVASAGVTVSRVAGSRSRNGPPEAVSTRRLTSRSRPARSAWWIAACSLSTGRIFAPEAAASRRRSGPAATIASLFASARSAPAARAAAAGLRPAEPTIAVSTRSRWLSSTASTRAASLQPTPVPGGRSARSRPAAASVSTTIRRGRNSRASSASRAGFVPLAASTHTWSLSGCRRATARAASPTEPVAPSTASFRALTAGATALHRPGWRRRTPASPAERCRDGRAARHGRAEGPPRP